MNKFLLGFLLLFAINIALLPQVRAQKEADAGHTGASGKLPTKDELDAAMKRTFGYDASITWNIYDIRPSGIRDLTDVLISIKNGQPQHIYFSADTQTAIAGEMLPFGPNPFAPARTKLQAADGPALGSTTPSILMVEFSDLECPHCKAAQPVVEKLVKDFPQVRYVFQQFPLPPTLHPWAMKAAEYADCAAHADAAAFWKYIDTIFENQGSVAAATADDKLQEFATTAGLDAKKLSTCAASPEAEARVKKSLELGQSLEVNSTPTLFVNGRRILGLADTPYEQLKSIVQFEIDHAAK